MGLGFQSWDFRKWQETRTLQAIVESVLLGLITIRYQGWGWGCLLIQQQGLQSEDKLEKRAEYMQTQWLEVSCPSDIHSLFILPHFKETFPDSSEYLLIALKVRWSTEQDRPYARRNSVE